MYGQMQAADAQEAQLRYQAAVQRTQADSMVEQAMHTARNAERVAESAPEAREEGQRQKTEVLRRAKMQERLMRQDFAARGVYVGGDDVIDELALMQQFARGDAERIYDNFERQALGFEMQSEDLFFNAEQQMKGANQALMNAGFYDSQASAVDPTLGMLGTAIGGAASITGQVFDAKSAGYFGGHDPAGAPSAMSLTFSGNAAPFSDKAYNHFVSSGWYVQ